MSTTRPVVAILALAAAAAAGCGARGSLAVGDSGGTTRSTTATSGSSTSTSPSAAACQPGDPPVMLVSGEDTPRAIALDTDAVYYVTGPEAGCAVAPRLKRIPKTGGAPTVVGSTMQRPQAIAADGESVYWVDDIISPCTTPDDPGFTVFAAPTTGGTQMAFPFPMEFQPARAIAVDDGFVYWLVQKGGEVRRAKKGGAPADFLYGGSIYGLGLALDDTQIYWTTEAGVLRAPKGGGPPVTLAPLATGDGATALAVVGGDLYFTGSTTCAGPCLGVGTLKHVSTGGSAVETLATFPDKAIPGLAVGGSFVYVVALTIPESMTPPTGDVLRVPRAGGAPEVVVAGRQPVALASDGSCVFWTDLQDGSVWRAPL